MHKALLTALATLTMAGSVSALGLEIKGGINLANMRGAGLEDENGKKHDDQKAALGAVVGVGLPIAVSEKFTIQPEVLFSQKGMSEKYEEGNDWEKETYRINYLAIPVLAKLTIPAGNITPSIYVGPEIGLALSAKSIEKGEEDGKSFEGEEEINDKEHNKIDFGIAMGAGVAIPAGVDAYEAHVVDSDGNPNKPTVFADVMILRD